MSKPKNMLDNVCIKDALRAAKACICMFFNTKKRKMYIVYTTNSLDFFCTTVKRLAEGTHPCKELVEDRDDLKFEWIESIEYTHSIVGKYKLARYIKDYTDANWTFYNSTVLKPIVLTPRVVVEDRSYRGGLQANVYLVTARYKRFFIKSFSSVEMADRYVREVDIEDMLENLRV
jgi:hypothetical protein